MTTTTLARSGAMNPMLVLLTASTGCAMTVLDTNVVGIVLPMIARDLGASFAEVEWVISSYVLCFASLLLPAGAIADRFGRRRVFLIGGGLFALASFLCGLAGSATALYLARAFQGVGAAFLLAPALAIIGHTFHSEIERNRAWAIWGGMMGLTMVIAPIIGGVIAYALGWRWAFNINLPICIVLAGAVLFVVPESSDENARQLDPAGIVLFAAGIFGLTSGLITGQAHGWGSGRALGSIAAGICGLLAFVVAEKVQRRPMLDLSLFRAPGFIGAVLAMFAYAACAQVMASLLPLFLQNGLGVTAFEAGFSMLPFAIAMLLFPQIGRRLGRYLASPSMLAVGLGVVCAGNLLTALGARWSDGHVAAAGMAVLGAGGGLLNGETQKAIMSAVPPDRAGMASGISTTARFSGILIGFALLSGVLATVARSTLGRAACCGFGFADSVVAGDLPRALTSMAPAVREAATTNARVAYSAGFSAALIVAAGGAAAAAGIVWSLMREKSS